ncbi:hypothetical protein M2345_003241 [Sphingobium sp. B8D3D]|nr:hypothetical protein [Sphingobium sp. B8D3D]MCW2414219.1 hypothetical protein [Sphingobium sp. B8D3A]
MVGRDKIGQAAEEREAVRPYLLPIIECKRLIPAPLRQ